MPRRFSRLALYIGSGLALVAGITCTDSTLGPSGSGLRAVVGFAPTFTQAAADIYRGLVAFQLEIDNVHVVLKRQDGTTAADTIIAREPGQDSLTIELSVALEGPEEFLVATIDLRDGEQILFSGTQQVLARKGLPSGALPPVALSYAGPGAAATDLTVTPAETTILATETVLLTATGTDAEGDPVPDLVLEWTVKDSQLGTVTALGLFTPTSVRGSTYVIARLPTNVRDSAKVTWTPIPARVVLISGGDQNGIVGRALAQPIVVEVQADDNLPVAGAVVSFTITDGGGSVSATSAITDADGRASSILTLGVTPGVNTLQASIEGHPPISVSANANPTGPGQLEITRPPSAQAIAGVPLAQQPVVQLRDSLGNLLSTPGLTVNASVVGEGRIAAGTTSANTDATGKATFANLQIDGVVGSAQLRFVLGETSVAAMSQAISLTAGYARKLTLTQQPSGSVLSGTLLLQQPQVQLRDAFGNAVSAAGVAVNTALIVDNEGRTLNGTATATTNASGLATFTDLGISGVPGTTRLIFSVADSVATTTSNAINVVTGTASTFLAVTSLLYADTAGAAVPGGFLPVVTVRDVSNNPVPGVEIKFRRHGSAGSSIDGQPDTVVVLITDASGNAALTSRRLQTMVGTDTVLVTAAGIDDTLSFVAAVNNATAAQLEFQQQPTNSVGGGVIAPAVVIALRDQYGNLAVTGPSSASSVTVSLAGGTTGAALGGTKTVTAVSGFATFADLFVDLSGTGYVLNASTPSITAVSSTAFSVSVGEIASLTLAGGDGQGALPGDELPGVLRVVAKDAGGNLIPGATITFQVDSGGGTFVANGLATLDTLTDEFGEVRVQWQVGPEGGPQKVIASANGRSVAFRAIIAEKLVMLTQPTLTPQSDIVFPAQPRVQLTDNAGNVVRRSGVPIVATMVRTPMVDAVMVMSGDSIVTTDASGVATFTNLTLTGETIQQVRLDFYHIEIESQVLDPNIAPANSDTITVKAGLAAVIQSVDGEFHATDAAGVTQLSVLVEDAQGNDVPGAAVFFEVRQGACGLDGTTVNTDASGVAAVKSTISATTASCIVRARFPGEFSEEIPGPNVQHRVFRAPDGVFVWTGAFSGDWGLKDNWLGGIPASDNAPVFIAGAARSAASVQSPVPVLKSVYVEANGWLNLNFQALTVAGDVASDGIIGFSGTLIMDAPEGATVRGNVSATLQIGPSLRTGCATQYAQAGPLSTTELVVNCPLSVDQEVSVNGNLHVQSNGGLLKQTKGTISVASLATFQGIADLQAGVLELKGNFIHDGNGDNQVFVADTGHITRFVGDATSQRELQWNVPVLGIASRFGILDFAATGESGTFLSWNPLLDISALNLGVHRILVQPDVRFTVPAIYTVELLAGGDQQSGPPEAAYLEIFERGFMRLDSQSPDLVFPLAICDSGKPLANDNPGPLKCTLTPK